MTEEGWSQKDESFWKLLSAAMELDVKKGHLKWTLTDLSRKTKITRSLIYYYFGRSKINILNEAIELIGDQFTGNTEERHQLWAKGMLLESMLRTRKMYDKAPYICQFFLEHRDQSNEVGERLRAKEKSFRKKLKDFYPHLSDEQVQAVFAAYWGMSFAPGLTEEGIEQVVYFLKKILKRS